MRICVHRVDKLVRQVKDADAAQFSDDWIVDADLSAVEGVQAKYWNIAGDVISEMTDVEKRAVDAAERSAARDTELGKINKVGRFETALALIFLDQFNAVSTRINAIQAAIRSAESLADVKTAVSGLADMETRTPAQLKAAMRAKMRT